MMKRKLSVDVAMTIIKKRLMSATYIFDEALTGFLRYISWSLDLIPETGQILAMATVARGRSICPCPMLHRRQSRTSAGFVRSLAVFASVHET